MPTFHRLQDIRVWHLARQFVREIYRASDIDGFKQDAVLRKQIRSASVSIVSNISEGFERDGNREFIQFLSQAKGSAGEVVGQLYIAHDLKYLDDRAFLELRSTGLQILRMIDKLITHLRTSEFKGRKFQTT